MKKESNEEDSDEKKYYQKLPDNRKSCYLTHKK